MEKQSPIWLGPVLGALILVVGYVGYHEWKERHSQSENCAKLSRLFHSNMDAMMGPTSDAIAEAKRLGHQGPMGNLAGSVTGNKVVMEQLNTECPGWIQGAYD